LPRRWSRWAWAIRGSGIQLHTPTDNAEIERYHRTVGEKIDEHNLEDVHPVRDVVAGILDEYNHRRLHSSLRSCGRWTIIVDIRRRYWPSVAGSCKWPENCESRRT